jgi:NAD(P)-dependent dehydrogenase (short-subunit alcohol dehydrogenase family)
MKTVFITGANRGLGLGFVKVLLEKGNYKIFASCRKPSESGELLNLKIQNPSRLFILELDVASDDSITNAIHEFAKIETKLDILINNVGINSDTATGGKPELARKLESLDRDILLEMFNVNTVAPILLAKSLKEQLSQGDNPLVVNISSSRASFADKGSSANYGYRASKVALNMMTNELALELKPLGINTFCIEPGWVKTDMNDGEGELTPEESAARIVKTIESFDESKNGKFLSLDGELFPQ